MCVHQRLSCLDLRGALGSGVPVEVSQGSLVEKLTCENSLKEVQWLAIILFLERIFHTEGIISTKPLRHV